MGFVRRIDGHGTALQESLAELLEGDSRAWIASGRA